MEKYKIKGGKPLKGEIEIGGAKNAAVAIIPATLLAKGPCVLRNLPEISDVSICFHILRKMGASVTIRNKHTAVIDTSNVVDPTVPYDLAKKMRASYYFLGALLSRFHSANVAMPGGCDFGVRPIDLHLKGFKSLGADYDIEGGIIHVRADKLTGTKIYFDVVSVGATINILLASVAAEGLTIIENAAKEPHIVDLANFLNSMGADIMGAGTNVIKVRGTSGFHPADYSIIPDQIEAGTYMLTVAATGGDAYIKNVIPKHLEAITAKLVEIGAEVEEFDDCIHVSADKRLYYANVKTMPYPGFPTDMQPQMTTLLALSQGTSIVTETIFETRFKYISELRRMGANITVEGNAAFITGVEDFTCAQVSAPDLRAGAALVMAGLAADGITYVKEIQYIERGYENFVEKICGLGGCMEEVDSEDERAIQKFKMKAM